MRIDANVAAAMAMLEAAGFKVVKPRAVPQQRPTLNALGRPISPLYDPNYKMRTPRTTIARLAHNTGWLSQHMVGV